MSKEVYQCPVCDCHNTEAQHDYPHISECNACGSEWITETGEITLDAYKDVS
jgi:ribosomal protein L37AE/L43A